MLQGHITPVMTSRIPIVDLDPLMALTSDPVTWSPDDDVIRALSDDIIKAFTDIGFVYVINHGISQEMVSPQQAGTDFFFFFHLVLFEQVGITSKQEDHVFYDVGMK